MSHVLYCYKTKQLLQGITRSVSHARAGNKALKMALLLYFRVAVAAIQLNLLNEFVNQSSISKVEHMSDLAIL